MKSPYNNGVWPVMLTPFNDDNTVDFDSLKKLVDWYIGAGVAGLFAVCQSSEMFFLSLEERVQIAMAVKEFSAGRVPVVASGHVSYSLKAQAKEITEIAATGVDAVILISNRLAKEDESDNVWIANANALLKMVPSDINLGFYECPYPYKRIITPKLLQWCVDSGRFYFIKDTSCNIGKIEEKLEIINGSAIKLFNANATTLLGSLKIGGSGFSGVMANFHPEIYVWLCNNYKTENAEVVASFLTLASFIERQCYPLNAKYFLKEKGVFKSISARNKDLSLLGDSEKFEVNQLDKITSYLKQSLSLSCDKQS